MKKVLCLLMCAVLTAAVLCACSKTEEFTPDYSAAIGAIFVNDQQELPENTKVYADFSDNTYSFDLDAACVYYFAAAGDVYYVGVIRPSKEKPLWRKGFSWVAQIFHHL